MGGFSCSCIVFGPEMGAYMFSYMCLKGMCTGEQIPGYLKIQNDSKTSSFPSGVAQGSGVEPPERK